MAWQDRLREAAYTSPSGVRRTFIYEDVSRQQDKKGAAFEFPDADGTLIQEAGSSGRRYPLRCIFSGADHDVNAEVFENALFETGIGILEHPMYGRVDVVPFGTITRRDALKTTANQSIVEVTFFATIGAVYPLSQTDFLSTVLEGIAEFTEAISEIYGSVISAVSALEQIVLKNTFGALLENMRTGLLPIAGVDLEFKAIVDSISRGLDALIFTPETLAAQTAIAVQTPAKSSSDITSKLNAYRNLIAEVTSPATVTNNEFYTRDLYVSNYTAGVVLSTVNTNFSTRNEALAAAEFIFTVFDSAAIWRDDNTTVLEIIDTGEAYQKLQDAVAITAGFLVDISFTLKQERRIILDRSRTIVDLSAELYGNVDVSLDLLISSNDLNGSEILELPKGKEIVYYI